MPKDKIAELENCLLDFVKRASSKDATAEEVNALPAVAELLAKIAYGF